MNMFYPPALKKGDTIGIVAPSSFYDALLLKEAKEFLNGLGFKLSFHPQINERYGQMAGTPEQRVNALHDYFRNPDIKAIFVIAGGNGAVHLLDLLDFDLIKDNPKILIGFSDTTILLNAISARTGLVTFHGPSLARLVKIDHKWRDQTLSVLMGKTNIFNLNHSIESEGQIWGGCLSPLQCLIGTDYAPDLDNSVLMLEDINDHLSRYDRMIGHMKQAGWLKNLSAVILGEFINPLDNKERPFGFNIEQMINNASGAPVITDAPIGHGNNLCTIPIGANVVLKNGTLSFKPLS